MASLRETNGTRVFDLTLPVTLVGRDPGCDIVLASERASRRHASVVREGGRYFLEDMRSSNGTFLNGRRVLERTPLGAGDRLELPGLSATFEAAPGELGPGPAELSLLPAPSTHADSVPPDILSTLDATAGPRPEIAPEAKLRAVLQISDALGTALALDKVLPTLLECLFTLFPQANRGFIILRDPVTGKLVPKAVLQRAETGGPVAVSRTVIDHTLATRQAILSADVGDDMRFRASESIQHLGIRSVMCAPLLGQGGEGLGVIQVDTRNPRHVFRQEDLELLACATLQASRAIELARLHEELRDLEAATRIQQSFLPEGNPSVEGLEFFGHYSPARHIGGDYYDYIPLPGNRLAVAIGDVAGKGIAASLLMARLSAAARFYLATVPSPPDAVRQLNLALARTFEDRFITLLLAVIDLATYSVCLVNAGHPPPLRVRAKGPVEALGEEGVGIPLAGIDRPYKGVTVTLEPGDVVALYTDGVTEARNPEGELYGLERLTGVIRSAYGSAAKVGAAILAEVNRFSTGLPQSDDRTLVCVGRTR